MIHGLVSSDIAKNSPFGDHVVPRPCPAGNAAGFDNFVNVVPARWYIVMKGVE